MAFQSNLLRWFSKNARPLPWRKHYRPYQVWISEIMLQQTQMDTVLPYYERWMQTFPDIPTLASADESKVLKHWEGLGYYSRARSIHATAREIMQRFNGRLPSDYETVLSLKGIGRYSAGAICSIAFNQPKPIVDGNVLRVLSRVYAIRDSIDIPKNREKFWPLQEKLIPKNYAREFNQALMELGALICTPKKPLCSSCPLLTVCRAAKDKNPEIYPVRKPRKKTVRVTAAAITLHHQGAYLLTRRPVGSVMGGLWEFPEWKLASGKKLTINQVTKKVCQQANGLLEQTSKQVQSIAFIKTIKRNYTHHQETMHVFSVPASNKKIPPGLNWKTAWVKPENFKDFPFSSGHAKIAALLR